MSIWTFVEGSARVRKNASVGIKELILKTFEHHEIQADVSEVEEHEREDSRVFDFRFSFSCDGMSAAQYVEDFRVKAVPICKYLDMTASIRF